MSIGEVEIKDEDEVKIKDEVEVKAEVKIAHAFFILSYIFHLGPVPALF